MIDVFIQAMSNKNNSHLHNFYILLPSLSLNFIEHSINSKEKMYKKSKGAMFTDDGFAVGGKSYQNSILYNVLFISNFNKIKYYDLKVFHHLNHIFNDTKKIMFKT